LKEQFEPEAFGRWSSFKQSQEAVTLPATSHEGDATLPATCHAEGAPTSLLLRFHADEIVSHPSARVLPISQNKTFEKLLLEQVKQVPCVKTGRKRICGGTEVITSGEVSERMKETVSENVKDRNRQEKRNNQEKTRVWGFRTIKTTSSDLNVFSLLSRWYLLFKSGSPAYCNYI
jgi:hypothetical protein